MLSILLQLAVIYLPVMNTVFKTVPLALHHWVYMGTATVLIFILGMMAAKLVDRPNR